MNFFFMSGLPRTGSTVLSAILNQNPQIHCEGTSPLLSLMTKIGSSIENHSQNLNAYNRPTFIDETMREIPKRYYKKVTKPYVVDKSREWTFNIDLIQKFLEPQPKILVLVRPIDEIIKSFIYIRKKNNWISEGKDLLVEPQPIRTPFEGIRRALNDDPEKYLFIKYNDLLLTPSKVLADIYNFFELEVYTHTFDNISTPFTEDDSIYRIGDSSYDGLHEVRQALSFRNTDDIVLSQELLEQCHQMNEEIKTVLY